MPPGVKNYTGRQAIVDCINAGFTSRADIKRLIGYTESMFDNLLTAMIGEGLIKRTSYGQYGLTNTAEPSGDDRFQEKQQVRPYQGRGSVVESGSRQIDLSRWRSQRKPVELTLEQDPVLLENVIKLELCLGGTTWIPVPLYTNTRVFIGEKMPRWTPEQEEYRSVSCIRVTFSNGEQHDFNHNLSHSVVVAV